MEEQITPSSISQIKKKKKKGLCFWDRGELKGIDRITPALQIMLFGSRAIDAEAW